ncbi:MAG: Gfo/Idh/MocA family protein [Bacillota bacterium]
MTEKLRVGVIGTGMAFERLHYPAFVKLADKYEIAAVCDPDRFKAEKWANKLGLDKIDVYAHFLEMTKREDIDVFDIIVPIELNYEITRAVAEAIAGKNKGIICEKPLAPNAEEAEFHRELPKEFRIPVMIAENYRYSEEMNILRDIIRQGKIGAVNFFLLLRAFDFKDEMGDNNFAARDWRQHPEFEGGIFLDASVHDMAALRHIFGAISKVQAFGQRKQDIGGQWGVINLNILFQSGMTGQYTFYAAGKQPQYPPVGLRIFGEKGLIYLEDASAGLINVFYNDGGTEQMHYEPGKGYFNELLNFYRALQGKEPLYVSPEMEYGDAKTIFAALRSIAGEEIVPVDVSSRYEQDARKTGEDAERVL